jgi:hypothetical protein
VVMGSLLGGLATAQADSNDLVLSRLADNSSGRVVADNAAYRSLTSELGVALAPHLGTPADTLGWSGLELTTDMAFSSISGGSFWCATQSTASCTPRSADNLSTFGIFVRKGISLPVPSLELSAGTTHLMGSSMWTGQVSGKAALLEGFHGWAIPSFALRFAAARLFGSPELDLTTLSADLTISKTFGVGDRIRLSPWAGYNILWIVPRSGVIDKTPQIDATVDPTDLDNNFTFADQDTIVRQRLFIGAKARYGAVALSFEAVFAFAGSSTDDQGAAMSCAQAPATMKDTCNADDGSGAQQTYTISLSADF